MHHHCADATQNVQPTCDELIVEQWKEVIMKQPYTDEHRIRVTTGGAGGRQLDVRPPPPAPFPLTNTRSEERRVC